MASLNEVEAILVTAMCAGILAVWGIITQRIVTRRSNTLDYLWEIDSDKDLLDARKDFIRVTKEEGGIAKYAEIDKRISKDTDSIRLILNTHERMAIGIQFGILDHEFVKRHSRGTILQDWSLAAPFVYAIRTSIDNPAIYHEFEELARACSERNMPRRSYWWRLWF